MIGCRNILLSGQTGPIVGTVATSVFTTPEIRAGAAIETVYRFVIEGITGSPTTASLTAKFQMAQRTTGGQTGGAGAVTDALPIWSDMNADTGRDLLPDGDWPTLIADQTLASPLVIVRRVKGGFSHRLAITPTFTGGTSPAFSMTLEAEVRY